MADFLQEGTQASPELPTPGDFAQESPVTGTTGVLLKGTFWYFQEKLSQDSIAIRQVRAKLSGVINGMIVLAGVASLLGFFYSAFFTLGDALLELRTWLQPESSIALLWLSLLLGMFLFYRVYSEKTSKKTVPPADEVAPEVTTIPSLDVVERKRDIAEVLSKDSQEAIDEAYRLARKAGHGQVEALHLFLGTVTTSTVQMLFMRLGITFERMKEPLRRRMSTIPTGSETEFGNRASEVLAHAFRNAVQNHRKELTVVELFLEAYKADEYLQELFFSLNVEREELENVVAWVRINEQLIERYHAYRRASAFKPAGNMDRAYTARETKFLDAVSEDLTRAGISGHLPMLVDREREMNALLRSIEGGGQSVVLVGPTGVGKKTLIAGLAERMVEERVPKVLQDKRLIKLSIPHILSAQSDTSAEEQLLYALQEVGVSGNIVLAIDGIEQLVGVGNTVELANILAGELEKGYTFVIATTTPEGYTKLERSALGQKLQKIVVEEPERNEAIRVLESKIGVMENKHRVIFTYEAVAALVDFSTRYMHESFLPQKAILLAEEVALQGKTKGKDWLLIEKSHVAALISEKTRVPVTEVSQEEGQKLLNLEERMHERIIGQEAAVKAVSSALRRARVELRSENRPIANFLFLGPTGVGKTELAKTTAEVYFGNEEAMLRFDMSEYQDKASAMRLIGSPGEGGLLTEAVRKNPFALLLLDELEKAHPDILNLFLQVMDDGRLTDGAGRTVDFTNVILIATSNAGTQYIQEEVQRGTSLEQIKEHLLETELKAIYRPEFLNRFDGVMVFKPLAMDDVIAIAYLMIQKVAARLQAKGIHFQATDEAVHALAKKGFDPKFGARPLRRVIQEEVENAVAEFLLKGSVGRRDTLVLQGDGSITVEKAQVL